MKDLRLSISCLKNDQNDQPALSWPEGSFSNTEYLHKINQTAEILKSHNIVKENRVAILSDIDHRFPIIFFALLQLKAIVVPLNTRLPTEQINQQIVQLNCQFLITVDRVFLPSKSLNISILPIKEIFDQKNLFQRKEITLTFPAEQKATILFTSGSSGKAKAVLHSIGNHYYNALGSNTNILLKPGDKWLISLPFYHVGGIAILFRTMLAGGTSVIEEKDQPIYEQLMNNNITHLSLVPTQLHRLLNSNLDNQVKEKIKAILVGGSNCSNLIINKTLQEGLPLYLSYGSTEMSSQITTTRSNENLTDSVTSGTILPYRELKIDQNNEILVKGNTLTPGYWEQEEIKSVVDQDGWFHTGDLGYLDKHKRLILKGRIDNMFISAGENIYPEEIENVLVKRDDIVEACVVAIADCEYGARPVVFLKMKENNHLDEIVIKEFLKDRISGIKIPVHYFDWPLSGYLKVDRKKLQILAQEMVGSE